MRSPSTLMFVLKFYGLPFVGGLVLLACGIYGAISFTPDPPGQAWESLANQFGYWPYFIGIVVGAGMAVYGWRMGSNLRYGPR